MVRHKIYDELEKEGYTFNRILINGQPIPKIEHLENLDDWAMVNTTIIINNQYQVEHGSAATEKTVQLLQKVIETVSQPGYSDYTSKSLIESTSE